MYELLNWIEKDNKVVLPEHLRIKLISVIDKATLKININDSFPYINRP